MVHHPRAESLRIREKLVDGFRAGIVAEAGLMAHGRGEAFDYLLGEKTASHAKRAIEASAATLILATKPVISVNGNAAALQAENLIKLAKIVNAGIEVNLYYRSTHRENAIKLLLESLGTEHVLGIGEAATARLERIGSERRRIDPDGIAAADVVLVPLEDGDRTEALVKAGKRVIAIDLNPMSRTARAASITIVDNIVRAIPALLEAVQTLKTERKEQLETKLSSFDNKKNLNEANRAIHQNLLAINERLTKIDGPSNRPSNRADSLHQLRLRKNGPKIIMLTAYDFQTAKIIDQTGIDIILVGDSLGTVFQGANDTKAVSMEQMLYHSEIVSRAAQKTPVIADMPAHSYENEQEALTNARMFLDVGVDGVKIEGCKPAAIKILVSNKIPVIGHIGLLPQTADRYSVRGRDKNEADQIFNDAIALDGSGVTVIILESITEELSKRITETIKTPTIGIGAGKYCDGQVLVTPDLLGLTQTSTPKFVKKYAKLDESIKTAISRFKLDVTQGAYPDREHTYH
jgi:4-phosphopantoate--beta-alanine ligase